MTCSGFGHRSLAVVPELMKPVAPLQHNAQIAQRDDTLPSGIIFRSGQKEEWRERRDSNPRPPA